MFCTNCGAEVVPGQKYCNKCGTPVNPGDVNVGQQQVVGFTPQPGITSVQDFKKPKTWPIVVMICAALGLIVGGSTFAFFSISNLIKDGLGGFESKPSIDTPAYIPGDEDDLDWDGAYKDIIPDEFMDEFDVDEYFEQFMTEDYEYKEYKFAETYTYADYTYVYGKDVIDDDTVIFNGKTIGGFCDYVDKEVLDGYHKIDRDLLYDLMEVHLIDPSFMTKDNTKYFEQSMVYCLTFTNEFSELGADLFSCSYMASEPTRYYYDVEVDDEFDQWVIDYSHEEVYMNYGETEYKSAGHYGMFSEKALSAWLTAIDNYFEIK